MIMFVRPGPSVPEQAVTSPVARENPSAAAAHRTFAPAAIGRHAGCGDGVDDGVVARAAEEGGEFFFLAQLGENLGAGHALPFERAGLGRFIDRVGNLLGDGDRGDAGGRDAGLGFDDHAGDHRTGARGGRGEQERPAGRGQRVCSVFFSAHLSSVGRFSCLGSAFAWAREAVSGLCSPCNFGRAESGHRLRK